MKYVAIAFFLLSGYLTHAQTCTGGLGDPIVNFTFGAGPNFGPALASGITNLQYFSGSCPSDGQYAIVNGISSNCFGSTWFNVPTDHTGNGSGYFMLINASFQPNDFYVQTVTGLCEGTSYQFAAWIMNMVRIPNLILPSIHIQIEKPDGTVLGDGRGDIPQAATPTWKQYAINFTTPPGVTSVVLRMTNNAPGGNGNDLALDDITFRAAGPSIALQVAAFASDTLSVCETDTRILSFSAVVESCYPTTDHQWQQSVDGGRTWTDIPGATNTTYDRAPTPAGIYLYRLKVAQTGNINSPTCSIASNPIKVVVNKIPVPGVTITTSATQLCEGVAASFTAAPTDGGDNPLYQWMVNGAAVGASAISFSSSTLADEDKVSCRMTSDAVCVTDPVVVSNTIVLSVVPVAVTGVSIASSAVTICSDSLVVFMAIPSNGGSAPSYQWTVDGLAAGADNPVYSTSGLRDGDVVSCVMTGSETCSFPVVSDNSISMTVYPLPVILLTPDTIIAAGSSIRLNPLIAGDVITYQWSPSTGLDDAGLPAPLALPVITTTYTLRVDTRDGCRAFASEKVNVFYDLLMPGGFTPNGDGKNDVFRVPPSVPVTIVRFLVYNRWGVRVFAAMNSSEGWDGSWGGKPQPAGVYVWQIEYADPITKRSERKRGTVVLVR
jgi:gliding motility-associated-like protein